MKNQFLAPLPAIFGTLANAEDAIQMKRYMKDIADFYGIRAAERKAVSRDYIKTYGKPELKNLDKIIKELWQQPEREYHYFAMDLAQRMLKGSPQSRLDLYYYMATHNSWWDTIDFIASNLMGPHFTEYPDLIKTQTRQWMDSGDFWLQRCALLFQLKYKNQTNEKLLYSYIEELAGEKEFFIRKAIGWSLRQELWSGQAWAISQASSWKVPASIPPPAGSLATRAI